MLHSKAVSSRKKEITGPWGKSRTTKLAT